MGILPVLKGSGTGILPVLKGSGTGIWPVLERRATGILPVGRHGQDGHATMSCARFGHDVFLFWWHPDCVVCTLPQLSALVSKTRS